MKKHLFLLVGLLMICSSSFAQSIKFGTVESQEIIGLMPETDSARVKSENYVKIIESELATMQQELQKKYELYQKNTAQYSAVMRQQKEKEIGDLQATIQQYQQIAQTDLQQKNAEFMAPVFAKLNAAIKKVSQANGITFVIDKSNPPFIYMNDAVVVDIAEKVKTELGLL